MKGVSRKTVTKWKDKGLVSMTPDGLVKIEESEWLLAERSPNYRGGAAKAQAAAPPPRPAANISVKPAPKILPDETPEEAAERIVGEEGRAPYKLAEAVRIKENYLSALG